MSHLVHLNVNFVVRYEVIYDTFHHHPKEGKYPRDIPLLSIYDQFYKEFVENDVFLELHGQSIREWNESIHGMLCPKIISLPFAFLRNLIIHQA